MSELRDLTAALTRQRRRLKELIEICGREDPEHPLQQFSLRRIAWLEREIEEIKTAGK
jgi:hypothetical protein